MFFSINVFLVELNLNFDFISDNNLTNRFICFKYYVINECLFNSFENTFFCFYYKVFVNILVKIIFFEYN